MPERTEQLASLADALGVLAGAVVLLAQGGSSQAVCVHANTAGGLARQLAEEWNPVGEAVTAETFPELVAAVAHAGPGVNFDLLLTGARTIAEELDLGRPIAIATSAIGGVAEETRPAVRRLALFIVDHLEHHAATSATAPAAAPIDAEHVRLELYKISNDLINPAGPASASLRLNTLIDYLQQRRNV